MGFTGLYWVFLLLALGLFGVGLELNSTVSLNEFPDSTQSDENLT